MSILVHIELYNEKNWYIYKTFRIDAHPERNNMLKYILGITDVQKEIFYKNEKWTYNEKIEQIITKKIIPEDSQHHKNIHDIFELLENYVVVPETKTAWDTLENILKYDWSQQIEINGEKTSIKSLFTSLYHLIKSIESDTCMLKSNYVRIFIF